MKGYLLNDVNAEYIKIKIKHLHRTVLYLRKCEQLISSVVDSGDRHKVANIFANFRNNFSKLPNCDTQGPEGN